MALSPSFFSPLCLPLSYTFLPSFCLSLLPGIGVRYLVPFSTSPHYWADYRHAFTPAKKKKKKNPVHRPTNPRPVQPAPCRWKPTLCLPLSLSLSLSLGQNNNEPTGPRLNRSRRRIMTWTFFLSHSTGRAYHWPTYTQDHHQAPGLPVLRQEEAPAWTPHSLQWTAAKIKGGGKCI